MASKPCMCGLPNCRSGWPPEGTPEYERLLAELRRKLAHDGR